MLALRFSPLVDSLSPFALVYRYLDFSLMIITKLWSSVALHVSFIYERNVHGLDILWTAWALLL